MFSIDSNWTNLFSMGRLYFSFLNHRLHINDAVKMYIMIWISIYSSSKILYFCVGISTWFSTCRFENTFGITSVCYLNQEPLLVGCIQYAYSKPLSYKKNIFKKIHKWVINEWVSCNAWFRHEHIHPNWLYFLWDLACWKVQHGV